MVSRNANGITIWWARNDIVGRPQPSEWEAMAVVFGIHTAIRHGWTRVSDHRKGLSFGAPLSFSEI